MSHLKDGVHVVLKMRKVFLTSVTCSFISGVQSLQISEGMLTGIVLMKFSMCMSVTNVYCILLTVSRSM